MTDGALQALLRDAAYPCVGAKSAINKGSYRLGVYSDITSAPATAGLARDLWRFANELDNIDGRFATFVATFDGPREQTELEFEQTLWDQLQALHEADAPHHEWDERVSSDPASPNFSFSFAGRAFFIVGLHPRASRIARRFPWPTIVFNAHEQFERLRRDGQMDRMKEVIRRKDEELQGEVNPVLRDFGQASEARQYSGREVEADWRPPFVASGDRSSQKQGGCPFHHLMARLKPNARSGS